MVRFAFSKFYRLHAFARRDYNFSFVVLHFEAFLVKSFESYIVSIPFIAARF